MILPRPRAYVDWMVPVDKNGNEIGVCEDDVTFDFYIGWLADYLYEKDIPIPECQQKDLKEFQEQDGIRSAVFWTANDGGLSIWDTEIIEMCFTDDVFFEEYHMEEVEIWDNTDADEKELYEDPENDFFTSEAEFNRICQEKKESLKVPSHIQHADVPYRPIFAKLIKSVHDKQERIQHLKWFYENFNECASK